MEILVMRPEHKKKKEHVSKFDKSRNKATRNTNGIKKERDYNGHVKRLHQGLPRHNAADLMSDDD